MKAAKRALSIIAVCAVLLACICVPASAISRPPYNGYTYNTYGQAVAAPVGYVPDKLYTHQDMGTTAFTSAGDMFIYNDMIFITDTGNNRIVVLDKNYKFVREYTQFVGDDGTVYKFSSPKGIYVRDDEIFVTNARMSTNEKGQEFANGDVLTGSLDGKFMRIFTLPEDATSEITHFEPLNVVVDNAGYVYVRAYGVLDGLIVYDYDGNFVTFYGANPVELTFQLVMEKMWKSIYAREAADQLLKAVPTEMSNIFVDDEGFIYTSTESTSVSESLRIRKLNAAGDNILTSDPNALVSTVFGDRQFSWDRGQEMTTRLVDVHVDESGIIAALDARLGRVFLYDQISSLLTVFGAQGDQFGAVEDAKAIGKMGENYVVLDAIDGSLTTYSPTDYMSKLIVADECYMTGEYIKGEPYWREVLMYDANNSRAYGAIGKSLLEQEKYGEALSYLKIGEDRTSYSKALAEYRTEFIRDNWMWLLPLVVVAVVGFVYLYKLIRKLLGLTNKKQRIKFK